MQNKLEELFEKLPKLNLSISGTRVLITWLTVVVVTDLVYRYVL
ncbi:hypothetical protein vBAmePR8F_gp30 [Alteromonas phage vB_AmeP_R8W]|uniref:Uncharacterized protein n=1 Tax=Alteromonas phage vB_AmeP_R8W TaxID=2774152 RepID=A0A8E4RFX8_9CAUD|nr:hypothetical protein vBAmePR8F_gp30 [Alteromonas phage vB_AmeP_R8W]